MSFQTNVIGTAVSWSPEDCGRGRLTLRSGDVLDVQYRPSADQGSCHATREVTSLDGGSLGILLHDRGDSHLDWKGPEAPLGPNDFRTPLVLAGSFVDGKPWILVLDGRTADGRWLLAFSSDDAGAYLNGNTLHLTTGLLLPLATDFEMPTYPEDPFPLRHGDQVWLNDEGEVVDVSIFLGGY